MPLSDTGESPQAGQHPFPTRIWDGDSFRAKESEKTIPINFAKADENYLLRWRSLKVGRNFSKDMRGDSARVDSE